MLGALRGSERVGIGELDHVRLLGFEPDTAGQQVIKAPLQPDRGDSAPAVIGDRLVIGDLGGRQEVLFQREKIGTPKIVPEGGDLLATLG